MKIAFQHPICVVFPYFVASLMFVLLTLFAFSVVCVPPFVIRCASADSIAEKTLQDKETRKEALRKVSRAMLVESSIFVDLFWLVVTGT